MSSSWTLIKDGTVIDGTLVGRQAVASILLQENRIYAVGEAAVAGAVPRGEPLNVIDAAGKWVMPGLIDAHCHMTYGHSRTQEEQDLYTSVEGRTLRAAWNVRKVLRAGVTGISQPGGSFYIGVAIRDAIHAGMLLGPRMTTAGRYITTSNGLTDYYPESVGVPDGSVGVLANTTAEMTEQVRRQVKNGVDLIKLSDSPYGEYQAFTGDELKAVADLTHQLHRKITIHARGSAEVSAAVAAGFDWIMHGNIMADDVIERLSESRIPLVPTLLLLANMADYGHLVGVPQHTRDGCRRMLDRTAETLHRAHEAGVTFLMGTDTGFAVTPYGEWHARELELLMTYAGLTPAEAIIAATSGASRVLGRENEVGQLRPGFLADILILAGDPLRDIRLLQDPANIVRILKDGQAIDIRESESAWPNERNMLFASTELTREVVARGGSPSQSDHYEEFPWSQHEAHDLFYEITQAHPTVNQPG